MQLSHAAAAVDVAFDDPNLIADAGLVPVIALAEQIGLPELVTQHVAISGVANSAGANPAAKVMSLLAGMVAGADSITDVDRLRHAGNRAVFDQTRAPSTLGTFLRAFTHGHVQQLNTVLRKALVALTDRTPLLPGADEVVFVDLDSTHRQVYGYQKQGAAVGRLKGRKTLHPLIATASTPIARPVMVAIRLRKGKAADVRGAARFLAEALTTVRAITPHARIIVRADSKFYTADVAATAARYGADMSLTTGSNPSITAAIAQIPDTAWTAIHYPNAFVDTETGELVSDAEVAEIPYTAFTSRPRHQHVHGRLIVRRVKRRKQPEGRCRAARTVRCLALSRRVRHQPVPDAASRVLPPRSRDRRAGHRGRGGQRAGAPALRLVHRERRVGGAVGDRAQPHPRRRRAGRRVPRPRHHRDHPRPPDHRAGPAGPLRPPAHPAPTRVLALATGLPGPARRGVPTTATARGLTCPPPAPRARLETSCGQAGAEAGGQRTPMNHRARPKINKPPGNDPPNSIGGSGLSSSQKPVCVCRDQTATTPTWPRCRLPPGNRSEPDQSKPSIAATHPNVQVVDRPGSKCWPAVVRCGVRSGGSRPRSPSRSGLSNSVWAVGWCYVIDARRPVIDDPRT